MLSGPGSDGDDDVALLVALIHVAVRLDDPLPGVAPVDDRFEFARLDQRRELSEEPRRVAGPDPVGISVHVEIDARLLERGPSPGAGLST